MKNRTPVVIVLPDIRSALNIGAIFRTADAMGAEKIFLTGYSATPAHPKVTKTALGAELTVPWVHQKDTTSVLQELREQNYCIVGLELTEKSTSILEATFHFPVALVVGNEIHGLSADALKLCDEIIYLPMLGSKESLNVATATGISLYEMYRQFAIASGKTA